jgi:hypothetical protein
LLQTFILLLCSFLLAQKRTKKGQKIRKLPRSMPTHSPPDFWANPHFEFKMILSFPNLLKYVVNFFKKAYSHPGGKARLSSEGRVGLAGESIGQARPFCGSPPGLLFGAMPKSDKNALEMSKQPNEAPPSTLTNLIHSALSIKYSFTS